MDLTDIPNNDSLLVKCKNAIEELLGDIETRKKENNEFQEKFLL